MTVGAKDPVAVVNECAAYVAMPHPILPWALEPDVPELRADPLNSLVPADVARDSPCREDPGDIDDLGAHRRAPAALNVLDALAYLG